MRAATRLYAAVLAGYALTAEAFAFAPPTSNSLRPVQQQWQHLRLNPPSAVAEGRVVMKGEQLFGSMVRGGGRRPSVALRASKDGGSGRGGAVDFGAIAKYTAGTAAEFGVIMGLLFGMQTYILPKLAARSAKALVFLSFGFLAMKSRTFSLLNARRPDISEEKGAKIERRRPDWMPPPKVFPVIWITIGVLRALSSTLVFEALGGKLMTTPIAAMILHLSVGDTWNHINNVEKRLGVAVPVVFLVWLSVAHAAFRYYQALPKAGFVLLPSVFWISIANLLVQSIWRLNGKQPLYPVKKA